MKQSNTLFILLFLHSVLPASYGRNNSQSKTTKAIRVIKHSASGEEQTLLSRKKRNIIVAKQAVTTTSNQQINTESKYSKLPQDIRFIIADHLKLNEEILINNIPYPDSSRCHTRLIHAIYDRDVDTVQLLLELGVQVNTKSCYYIESPLNTAIRMYHIACFPFNDQTESKKAKSYKIFKCLLNHGANPNNSTERATPLETAATHAGAKPLLFDLLNLPNLNPHATNLQGKTALDVVQKYANGEIYLNADYCKRYKDICILLKKKIAQSHYKPVLKETLNK